MEHKPYDAGAIFFNEMAAAMSSSSAPVAELLNRGIQHTLNEEWNDALPFFIKATEELPSSFYAWFCRGYTELSLMQNEAAETSLLRAREIEPENIIVRYWLAHINFLKDLIEEAVGEMQAIIACAPDFAEAYYDCGVGLQIMERYDDAMEVFQKRLEISPDFDTFMMMAMMYEYQQNYEKVAEFYEKALEMDPQNLMAIESHGAACMELGRFNDALQDFQYILSVDPENSEALYGRGSTFFRMGKISEAKTDLQKVISLDPKSAVAWSMLGQISLYQEEYLPAIRFFDKALEADPDILIYGFRGEAKMKMMDDSGAIQDFSLAIDFEPEEPDYYALRGQSHLFLRHFKEALADFNTAARLDPSWNHYDLRAVAHSETLNYEAAIQDFTHAIKLNPDDLDIYLYRAEVYCSLSQMKDAVKDIHTAIQLARKQGNDALAQQCEHFLKEITPDLP
ncbi:MAG: tetratricopeptide repeat protein [Planctomycetia bacterium]|nr:tetratricopeptide repeat protein [Planctomycetia bacterium]